MSVLASEQARLDITGADDRPLTEAERALLIRLLSDPFSFPITFKTWLISFIESSDILLPRSAVEGLNFLLGSEGGKGIFGLLPAGLIFPYSGPAAPDGALLCNGAAYSRAGYQRLYDVVGTMYGAPSGDTFSVPDLRRRIPWGHGAATSLGQNEGQAEAARSIDHHHRLSAGTTGVGNHQHGFAGVTDIEASHYHESDIAGQDFALTTGVTAALGSGGSLRTLVTNRSGRTRDGEAHQHGFSGGTDAQGAHSHTIDADTSGGAAQDHPAYIVVNFIINY